MNTTPENVPDETLLQAKVVRAQLLIKTNTRNIVHEVSADSYMIDLEIRTMQIGEFELYGPIGFGGSHISGQEFGDHRTFLTYRGCVN